MRFSFFFFVKVLKIGTTLIAWYEHNKRDLPWRDTKDPYLIWLSEIILQQTRVKQGLPYYLRFKEAFPTVIDLATADEQDVLRLWQGLGYYSRARNMHATARIVKEQYNGVFPSEYKQILNLKGVGEYTAAAVASFAFEMPYPVLDGNVFRVVSRLFGISLPINKPSGIKEIKIALNQIFTPNVPSSFNQAIMEFGAIHCTPKQPLCETCPFLLDCEAYRQDKIAELPYKEGKIKVKEVHHTYLAIEYENNEYIEKRTAGIWQNLHQYPLIEDKLSVDMVQNELDKILKKQTLKMVKLAFEAVHILSHRKIYAQFYRIVLSKSPIFLKSDIFEVKSDEIGTQYPTSVLTKKFLVQQIEDGK